MKPHTCIHYSSEFSFTIRIITKIKLGSFPHSRVTCQSCLHSFTSIWPKFFTLARHRETRTRRRMGHCSGRTLVQSTSFSLGIASQNRVYSARVEVSHRSQLLRFVIMRLMLDSRCAPTPSRFVWTPTITEACSVCLFTTGVVLFLSLQQTHHRVVPSWNTKMSHSVVITRTTTTTTSTSHLVLNTGYLKTTAGLLKLAQLVIMKIICILL